MNAEQTPPPVSRLSSYRNWMTLTGLVIILGSLFSFLLLFTLDSFAHFGNPYVGVLTYLVAPVFTVIGLALTFLGALLRHRKLIKAKEAAPELVINLSRSRDRRIMGYFLAGAALFLLLSAFGSYQTYHFTESVQFCGQACHTVMNPELISYQHGPHARVACTECHIGPGATWFVRSKLSGTYQVYATMANKFPRPIPTPIKSLRPAQETCEQCHWPRKFVGNLERKYTYFLSDQSNSVRSIRMLLKVGGADPTHGPVEGIHWHMNVANKIEYIATDEARQKIPWVRLTDPQKVVTEFRAPKFTNDISQYVIRKMDCMDCHNRPAHMLEAPNDAVNLAMSLNKIDVALPYIKSNAVYVLTRSYTNETEALENIATTLVAKYPDTTSLRTAIGTIQGIYTNNFFPEMKANWRVYPDNIGHKDWPGCARCHDDKHVTADGKQRIKFNGCNSCHLILAQDASKELNPQGQAFVHPGDELSPGDQCHDCHNGGL